MLRVNRVKKNYKRKKVLQSCTFEADRGDIIGLVGENGAGKSTLLKLIATVIQPTAGELELDGLGYHKNAKEIRKKIGYVPQDIAIWEEFTVAENMLFFEKLSWKRKSVEECRALCESMQLYAWKEQAGSLSGGTKRKLNLAISLLHDPDLLLLDEPTVGIDLKSKIEIGHYLKKLAKEEGKLIIYISHDMDEMMTLCDKVYAIGKDPFYKELLKEKNMLVEQLI